MNFDVNDIEPNVPFHFVHSLITLPSGFKGLIGVAIVDSDDNIKEVLKSEYFSTWSDVDNKYIPMGYAFNSYGSVTAHCNISDNDRLQLVSKSETDDEFKIILGTMEFKSYAMARNNQPRYSNLRFNIDENISGNYLCDAESEWHDNISSIEYHVLRGDKLTLSFQQDEGYEEEFMNLSIVGPQLYGNIDKTSDQQIIIAIQVEGDYDITAKYLQFENKDIDVQEAGSLPEIISPDEAKLVRELKIRGNIDARDIWYIRDNFASLSTLDMSNAHIQEVQAIDNRFYETEELQPVNTFPEWGLTNVAQIKSLILPEDLQALSSNSLMDLDLERIVIPVGVESIGLNVFSYNPNLWVVELRNPNPVPVKDCIFSETKCPEKGILYVPEGSKSRYSETDVWKDFGHIIEGEAPEELSKEVIIDGIKYRIDIVSASVLGYEGSPINVNIPDEIEIEGNAYPITSIGQGAFENCTSIESIVMSDNIQFIEARAFSFCTSLKEVVLSNSITSIPSNCFYATYNLSTIELNDKITEIGSNAFFDSGIIEISIPKNAKYENSASCFGMNRRLTEFKVAEGNPYFKAIGGALYRIVQGEMHLESVPCLSEGIFRVAEGTSKILGYAICTHNSSIEIPESVNHIESNAISGYYTDGPEHIVLSTRGILDKYAIAGCNKLTSITFKDSPSLNLLAIDNCQNLENIYIINEDGLDLSSLGQRFVDLNYFIPEHSPSGSHNNLGIINVPGKFNMIYGTQFKEMWHYAINRESGVILIEPQIDGIVIDKVTVNGKEIAAEQSCLYYYDNAVEKEATTFSTNTSLDVVVDYTLHNRQPMTTHYDAEFNAAIPDDDTAVISQIFSESTPRISIYNLQGICIKRNATESDIETLAPGLYVIAGKKILIEE